MAYDGNMVTCIVFGIEFTWKDFAVRTQYIGSGLQTIEPGNYHKILQTTLDGSEVRYHVMMLGFLK